MLYPKAVILCELLPCVNASYMQRTVNHSSKKTPNKINKQKTTKTPSIDQSMFEKEKELHGWFLKLLFLLNIY